MPHQLGDDFPVLGRAFQLNISLGINPIELYVVARLEEKHRVTMQLIGSHRRAAQKMPAARAGDALDPGLHAPD